MKGIRGRFLPVEDTGALPAVSAQSLAQMRRFLNIAQGLRQFAGTVWIDKPRVARRDLGQRSDVGPDYGTSRRHRLRGGESKALVVARAHQRQCAGYEPGDQRLRHISEIADA